MGPVGDAGQTVEAGGELEVLGDRLQLGHQIRIGKTVVERGHLIPPQAPQQGRQKDEQIPRQHAGDDTLLLVAATELEQHGKPEGQHGPIEVRRLPNSMMALPVRIRLESIIMAAR
jgi:hypothetical protein